MISLLSDLLINSKVFANVTFLELKSIEKDSPQLKSERTWADFGKIQMCRA